MDDGFYARLAADFAGWPGHAVPLADSSLRAECEALLFHEARLLDEGRFEDWLALYTEECLLWVPATVPAGDPRREVAVLFDDRRRLEDRIYRLRTGSAWSQVPPSRTVRLTANLEVYGHREAHGASPLMVRSTFLMTEFRAGETRIWSGWCAYRLERTAAGLRIRVKQMNLVDADQNLRNPSVLF